MRIIAGRWRGRLLTAPAGEATRPTGARAREALFSMLAARLGSFDDLHVLDLFAGSGALGLEALSRGAAHARFVETDVVALKAIRANVAALGAGPVTDVRAGDAARLGPAPGPHHLVFMDPPYGLGLVVPTLAALDAGGWLAPGALIAVETARQDPAPAGAEVERHHGPARLSLLRHGAMPPDSTAAAR